jgi:hypothetical protein
LVACRKETLGSADARRSNADSRRSIEGIRSKLISDTVIMGTETSFAVSAYIGVGSAEIGAFEAFGSHRSVPT